MVYVGGIIVILTFAAIVKGYETRLTLFVSGLVMSLLVLKPMAAFDAFFKRQRILLLCRSYVVLWVSLMWRSLLSVTSTLCVC